MSARTKNDATLLAERAVLGGLLLDNDARAKLNGLSPSDFGLESNCIIFRAILDEIDEIGTADTVSVFQRLERNRQAERAGGLEYLHALAGATPGAANIERHADLVHRAGEQRKRAALYAEAIAAVNKGDRDGEAAILRQLDPARSAKRDTTLFDRLQWTAELRLQSAARYIVKGLIDDDSDLLIVGAPNCGKTFFGLDLGLTLSSGLGRFFGMRCQSMPVVYFAIEGSEYRINNRVLAWCRERDIKPSDCKLAILKYPLAIWSRAGEGRDVAAMCSLLDRVRESHGGGPVGSILDTVTAASPGANLNMPDDSSQVTNSLRDLRTATGRGFAAGIHHSPQLDPSKPAGHHNFSGQVDTVLSIVENVDGTRTIVNPKQRDGERVGGLAFRLPRVVLGQDDEGDPITTCIVEPCEKTSAEPQGKAAGTGKHQRTLLDAIRANGPWSRQQAVEFMEQAGIAKKRHREVIDSLLTSKLITDTVVGLRA